MEEKRGLSQELAEYATTIGSVQEMRVSLSGFQWSSFYLDKLSEGKSKSPEETTSYYV